MPITDEKEEVKYDGKRQRMEARSEVLHSRSRLSEITHGQELSEHSRRPQKEAFGSL